jgi:hypothetical protein
MDTQQPPQPQVPPAREPVLGLLQTFAASPHCDKYSTDSKKIDLILTYLWLRQLTEGLTFEVFLAKFAAVADFDEQNRKYPEDALKHNCPRSKKLAEAAGVPQWSAKQCTEILSVYVDLVREAEQQNVEVPMTLDEYLAMDGPNYQAGTVAVDRPVKKARQSSSRASNAPSSADPTTGLTSTNTAQRPTGPDQRIIYEVPGQGGRQIKGTTNLVNAAPHGDEQRWYVSFETDEGEVFSEVNILHCTLLDEAVPPKRADVVETKTIWVPKAQYPQIVQALALETAMGNVEATALIYPFSAQFDCGLSVDVGVINSETGPYVEAQLFNPANDDLIETLPPRQNIVGEYRFETTDHGVLVVVVRTRE